MTKLGKKIKVAESRMVQQQEEYLENVLNDAEQQNEQGRVVPTSRVAQPISEVNQQMQTITQPVKAKKDKNGIVIDVPMADYMQLTMLKIQTGRTLKDLALQAIHEFVERNKME